MTQIGNEAEAEFIAALASNKRNEYDYPESLEEHNLVRDYPEWTRVGGGSYRNAYLSPSGVIYKVDHYQEDSYAPEYTNEGERENYQRIMEKKPTIPGWRVAKMSFYVFHGENIIAAEYVQGEHEHQCYSWDDCYVAHAARNERITKSIVKANKAFDLQDIHIYNYKKCGRTRVLIDIGS